MSRPAVIVVADHDTALPRAISELSEDGYDLMGPMGPLDALRSCSAGRPAAVLVHAELRDLSVGEFSGLVRGRAGGAFVPILVYGGGALAPVMPAFAGIDGYVSAGDGAALRQRLRALIGRPIPDEDEPLVIQYEGRHLKARFDRVEIVVDNVRVDLARRELALLQFLVTHANRVLGRGDILSHVWRDRTGDDTRTLDTHIRRLRMKLAAAGRQIQTVPGVGYRFSED